MKVKVFAGAKKREVVARGEDSFEVRVKEKAERGMANKAARNALAVYFDVSETSVKLIKGGKQPNKIFKI